MYLQVSPFWGWSTPQTEREGALGYTTIATDGSGIELSAETLDQQLLAVLDGARIVVLDKYFHVEASDIHILSLFRNTDGDDFMIRSTGAVSEYRSEAGTPAPAITDVQAFSGGCRRR